MMMTVIPMELVYDIVIKFPYPLLYYYITYCQYV